MKNKLKLCLLLTACVMIVSLSTVSATNVTCFKEMNTEIQAGNNVTLTKDIIGLDGIKDGISINGKTTVNGNGYTIDAQKQGRFFNIGSTGELTLKNIILKNGKKDYGGAIYNKGTLTIINSTFTNNNATYCGGAIYSENTVTCINSTFTNNEAWNCGAIYSKDVCVKYCSFTENKVNCKGITVASGGAINCQDLNECVGCNFIKNSAKYGGAIQINGRGTYTVKDCIFQENNATIKGGAIAVASNNARIHLIHNQWLNNNASVVGENIYNSGYYYKIEHNYCEGSNTFYEYRSYFRSIQHKDNNPCHTIEEWYKYKTTNNILTSINKDIENNNSNKTFSNMSNSFTDSMPNTTSLQVSNPTSDMSKPFNSSTGTPWLLDENNCFEMIIKSNRGTNYNWIVDTNSTRGVDLINIYIVDKNPEGLCGGEITNHFVFHIIDKNYFVRLNLIEGSTGKIENTVTSDMVN